MPGKRGNETALYSLKVLRGSIFKGWFLFRGSFWNRECVTIDADAGVACLKPSFLRSLCRLELDVTTCIPSASASAKTSIFPKV